MSVHNPSRDAISMAADHLRNGRLVAFPTETVYGLGGDATNAEAVAKIFAAKSRPRFNPLIIHVPDLIAAKQFGDFGASAEALAQNFWPGALALVVPLQQKSEIADLVTAGLDTIAIRVPDHPIAQQLLHAVGRPLAAPSANRSGAVSPTRADHVAADLCDEVAMILDGGATPFGIESTVVSAIGNDVMLLRPGAVSRQDIEVLDDIQLSQPRNPDSKVRSPGQLQSHYAPQAHVRLNATSAEPGEALLAFGPNVPVHHGAMLNLSPTGDIVEAAAGLFSALRELDQTGVATIAVMEVPKDGLGEAINDRLNRAAAPRS
ncbi:MAG: threonylcarbamoyl-AMP synthase [Alphaproteobacteria bacterium]|nr:threonylcarbamoyl-AMP synthase [Alphaproteobacteria bacterium]